MLSGFLDPVEPGEKMVIVRHGERVAWLRAYRAPEGGGVVLAPTLAEK